MSEVDTYIKENARMKNQSMKKFEMTTESKINIFGNKLFRIKALISFGNVKEGDTGGWVEKEENLSHSGNAWVCGNAEVYGDAWVCGNARVYGNAEVYGDAWVCGNARVYGNVEVCGNAWVHGDAWVYGDARVYGNARVYGDARVCGNAEVCGNADYATIHGFGTQFRTTTFFRCKDKQVRVRCGCFFGTIPKFREQVKKTREGKIAEEYLMIADLMEKHFTEERESGE